MSQFSTTSHLRVVYDHIQGCSPSTPSLVLTIESSEFFYPYPRNNYETRCISGIPTHDVRVVPVTRIRRHPLLSPETVAHIVGMAVAGKLSGWQRELLSYGMVCKAWAHVLRIFFKSLHVRPNDDRPDAFHVAHSLNYHPHRARLIYSFSASDYRPYAPQKRVQAWLHFMAILQQATAIKELTLVSVPRPVSSALVLALSQLRDVRRCYMPKNDKESHAYDISAIQTFIAKWCDLCVLEIGGWEAHITAESVVS
ncbi:hypothetical protein DXG01_004102 [Tephrocybe rancida]|nr:hypothetical protein DXG01_004102 [Tephrocybe rancida]